MDVIKLKVEGSTSEGLEGMQLYTVGRTYIQAWSCHSGLVRVSDSGCPPY